MAEPIPFPAGPTCRNRRPVPRPDNLAAILEEIAAISDRLESLGIPVLAEMGRRGRRPAD